MIGGASPRQLASLTTYGEHFGLAFQITDDILDEIGSEAALGKATRKDQAMGKLTYPRVFGLKQAKAMARESVRQCLQALDELPEDTHILRELALMVVERDR
jgi:geranylgeranyl diphosphate synthase type II